MSDFITSLKKALEWIRNLSKRHTTFFPQKHGKVNYRFAVVDDDTQIQFVDYRPTIVPPVKLMFPAKDKLLEFSEKPDGDMDVNLSLDNTFRILAGVRPCDLKGIFLMDLFFHQGVSDPHYLTRRENTAIIAYDCPSPCDHRAFCASVDSLDHNEGADVLLTPVKGDQLLVEVKTPRGLDLLEGTDFDACDDGPARKIGSVATRTEEFGRFLDAKVSDLPGIINKHWHSPVWENHVRSCFSCGTCNLVCPTCFCFDIKDDLHLDAVSGVRERTWDACMIPHFATVAGGHNFRSEPASRQRHRVKKKFEYLPKRFGYGSACIGCGRCGRQCTSSIDIFDIVNDLIAAGGQS